MANFSHRKCWIDCRICCQLLVRWEVDLRIDIAGAAHGAIEPRAAVAEFDTNGRLTVWAGSQDAFYVSDVIASELGLSVQDVTLQTMRLEKTKCTATTRTQRRGIEQSGQPGSKSAAQRSGKGLDTRITGR